VAGWALAILDPHHGHRWCRWIHIRKVSSPNTHGMSLKVALVCWFRPARQNMQRLVSS